MNEELDLIHVTDVEYIKDYTMLLTFSNGHKRIVEWYNGVDFAPDFLYVHGREAA